MRPAALIATALLVIGAAGAAYASSQPYTGELTFPENSGNRPASSTTTTAGSSGRDERVATISGAEDC